MCLWRSLYTGYLLDDPEDDVDQDRAVEIWTRIVESSDAGAWGTLCSNVYLLASSDYVDLEEVPDFTQIESDEHYHHIRTMAKCANAIAKAGVMDARCVTLFAARVEPFKKQFRLLDFKELWQALDAWRASTANGDGSVFDLLPRTRERALVCAQPGCTTITSAEVPMQKCTRRLPQSCLFVLTFSVARRWSMSGTDQTSLLLQVLPSQGERLLKCEIRS